MEVFVERFDGRPQVFQFAFEIRVFVHGYLLLTRVFEPCAFVYADEMK